MPINPESGEFITLQEAKDYVLAYRKAYPNAIKGYFAGLDKVESILGQDKCIGIRIYNGYSVVEKRTNLVIVGVNDGLTDMTSGLILEKTIPCPNECDTTSELYS
jgi:hypothetical protein